MRYPLHGKEEQTNKGRQGMDRHIFSSLDKPPAKLRLKAFHSNSVIPRQTMGKKKGGVVARSIIIVGKMVSNFEDAEMLFLFTCASLARPEALQQPGGPPNFITTSPSLTSLHTSIRQASFDLKRKEKKIVGHYRSRLNKEPRIKGK